MLYLSIAVVIIAIILTIKPPSLTINHTYKQIPHILAQEPGAPELTSEELEELTRKNQQPTYDDVMAALNDVMHEIGGDNAK